MEREDEVKPIIGIDFGTTNSEVAVYQSGRARIIPDREGQRVIPSAVYIAEGGRRYVGQAARNVAVLHPERTVLSVKRELGTSRRWWIDGQEYTPEQIASFVFAYLKEAAEEHLRTEVKRAVVTVPAYFDDPRRQAVKRAAALAGLEVVRLVNEPTAAALAHGVDSGEQGTVLVYDLGGGTFDVSVLQAAEGVFQVLATRGDVRLGGDDFDREVAEVLLERFKEETGIDLKGDRLALQKIYQEAEALKIRLSEHKAGEAEVPFIAANLQGPCHLTSRFSRQEFEELIGGYVDKTLRLTRGALQDAGLRAEEVDRVLLVGGSARIPAVRRAVEGLFGKKAEAGPNPEEIVACGAAAEAGILAGQAKSMALVDVTPLGLGVETADGRMVTLVSRNTVLPAQSKALFTTVVNRQKAAGIKVLQGERPRAQDNILLGSFRLEGIRPAKQGEPDIEVCFEIDVEGIVNVSAEDLDTGSSRSVELDGRGFLSEERLESILTEARAAELEDLYCQAER
jgi:molecular chaperone DnaK